MPLRSGVHAKRADELSEHKGETEMPELDKEYSKREIVKLLEKLERVDSSWVSERKNILSAIDEHTQIVCPTSAEIGEIYA